MTLDEFAAYAETFARETGEPGTLSARHLQRLLGPLPDGTTPALRPAFEVVADLPSQHSAEHPKRVLVAFEEGFLPTREKDLVDGLAGERQPQRELETGRQRAAEPDRDLAATVQPRSNPTNTTTPTTPGAVKTDQQPRSHHANRAIVRNLLVGRGLGDVVPDPGGLQLRGARIRGRLDLDLVDTTVALELVDCLLDHGVTAEQAHLPVVRLYRCRLSHPNEPAFSGDDLRVDGQLDLDEIVIVANCEAGAVQLERARIGGQLSLRGATLRNLTRSCTDCR